jgi:hypothetical protein
MGKPKKQTSPRKTGLRRSHLRLELARAVNRRSPVKVRTTAKENGRAGRGQESGRAGRGQSGRVGKTGGK